jgi:PadR family transcriptional regulator PadR
MRKVCGKVVVENFFEPCVLTLLMSGPSYGYELKSRLNDQCSCQVDIGNLYRSLNRMQKDGYVTKRKVAGEAGPDRQIYSITARGKGLLAGWMEELDETVKMINKLVNNYKRNYGK